MTNHQTNPHATGTINILLMGGGAREHAIAWKLSQSPRLGTLYTTHPGNPGIAALAVPVPEDVPVDAKDPFRLQRFCQTADIGLVIIGPEDPLAAGFADVLRTDTTLVFGPSKEAAQLESDKAWSKTILRAASVPMADGRVFRNHEEAHIYLESREEPPVIKAAGLAKGKGVIIPETVEESLEALDRIMKHREFGDAGNEVVIEERLEGREVSVLALVDGRTLYVLEPCQDHKRLADGDAGPNTGGMGAFCPGGTTDDETLDLIQSEILVPTVDAMRREGIEFVGVLYAGLMLTPAGPKVLEFNVRFGDPECQSLMARLDTDLIDLCVATCTRSLGETVIDWNPAAACTVVLASHNYPASPRTGDVITGLDDAAAIDHVQIFHAGTAMNAKGEIITAGGRVLSVTAVGDDLTEARDRAYAAAELINFPGKQMRTDIGATATV